MTIEEYLQKHYTTRTAKAYIREIEIYMANNPNNKTSGILEEIAAPSNSFFATSLTAILAILLAAVPGGAFFLPSIGYRLFLLSCGNSHLHCHPRFVNHLLSHFCFLWNDQRLSLFVLATFTGICGTVWSK
jgi:hypothetical protein